MWSKMSFGSVTNFRVLVLIYSMSTILICAAVESNHSSLDMNQEYRKNVCTGKPICNLTVLPQEGYYKCMCDSNCSYFGDCCPDSPYNTNITYARSNESQKFSCVKKFKFYLVNKCPSSFGELETKMKCENVSFERDYEDLKIMKPVMDPASRITYLNAYCALCNGVSLFESFRSSFSCKGSRRRPRRMKDAEKFRLLTQVLSKAKFNNETKLFTSVYNDTKYNCSHQAVAPTQLEPYLRYCEPELIASCPSTFKNSVVREKCLFLNYAVYSHRVRSRGRVYKNSYCAYCNGVKNINNLYQCQNSLGQSTRSGSSSLFLLNPSPGIGDACEDPELSRVLVC